MSITVVVAYWPVNGMSTPPVLNVSVPAERLPVESCSTLIENEVA